MLNYIIGDGVFAKHYFYLDKEPYLADKIFREEGLRVHFAGDFKRDDLEYTLVHAWVWRWHGRRMEKCMERLRNESLLKRRGYMEDCDTVFGALEGKLAQNV